MIEKIGLGGGKREYKRPGILRAILIREEEKEQEKEKIWKLESNIDDCTGENLGYVLDRLMEAGARDVHYSAVYMKKNSSGVAAQCDLYRGAYSDAGADYFSRRRPPLAFVRIAWREVY